MKKILLLSFIAFWLIPLLSLTTQDVFAGDPGSQSADWSSVRCAGGQRKESYYDWNTGRTRDRCVACNASEPGCLGFGRIFEENQRQKQFAMAQMRNEGGQSPRGGLSGGDTPTRYGFSFFASILVLLGGIWTLFILLRDRFVKNRRVRPARVWAFPLKPSFALSVFGFLFAATIIGSFITAPKKVTAEKRKQPDKSKMTGLVNPSSEPVFKSAQQIGSDLMTQIGPPVFDSAGNRYVRGGFSGDLQIGATTLTATAGYDLFLAKYDASGNPLWARQAAGARQPFAIEGATALAVDPSGNVYVGGSFAKQAAFQGGANSVTLADAGGSGVNYESFVAKYDASGNLQWAKGGASGSPQNQSDLEIGQNGIAQIVFDASGNPYVAGFVSGNNFLGSTTAVSGQTDILLAKLDKTTGAVAWRQVIGGTEDDNGLDLKTDGSGNLYLIGNFGSPQITFPNGAAFGNQNDPNDQLSDSTNTFVAKFDQSGNNLWVKNLDNSDMIGGSQIAVNGAGEIFLTGYFFDSATFGNTTLTEAEASGEGAKSLGGYVAKMDSNGNFVWAKGFGGIGQGLALDAAGRVYLIGTFFDGGTFGFDTPNEEALASFGGQDMFVARYDANGGFDWAKAIAGSGYSGTAIATLDNSENYYFPFGIAYNPARGTMFIAGDFRVAVALDCLTLTTAGEDNNQSYLAELSADDETTSCRVWNGLDADDNNFDSPDNWNGGVLPSAGDSVYVPYTGNNFDAPDFNPAANVAVGSLSIADDRVLTLEKNLTVNNRLDLLGGYIDAGNFTVSLGGAAQALSVNEGFVAGNLQKQFGGGAAAQFRFPVGAAASYLPLDVTTSGTGDLTVKAVDGVHPNLPNRQNALTKYWTLNGTLVSADLVFNYNDADVSGGEANLKLFKINPPNAARQNAAVLNANANTMSISNVTNFSDWALGALASYEGDVGSRPGGDGLIQSNDVTQTQRFEIGLDRPFQSNEFQRADTAPFSTRGNGVIDSADTTQAQRYEIGLDPRQIADGPTAPIVGNALAADSADEKTQSALARAQRQLRIESATATAGQQVAVNLKADAVGDESGYGFTLIYDAAKLTASSVMIGTAGRSRNCNLTVAGEIRCSVRDFPNNNPASSTDQIGEIGMGGNQLLVTIRFTVAAGTRAETTPLTLSNVNASNDAAQSLAITGQSGTVTMTVATAAVSGRVSSNAGRGIPGAAVTITDQNGQRRTARTNSFGYYEFNNLTVGATYVIGASAKRYSFASQAVNLTENLTEMNFSAR